MIQKSKSRRRKQKSKKNMNLTKIKYRFPPHQELFNLLHNSNERVDLPFNDNVENVDTTSPNMSMCKILTEKMLMNAYMIHTITIMVTQVSEKIDTLSSSKDEQNSSFVNNLNNILIKKQETIQNSSKTWSDTFWSWIGY